MSRARIFKDVELPSLSWHLRSWEDIKNSTVFTKMNWINIAMLVSFVFIAIRQIQAKKKAAEKIGFQKRYIKAPTFPEPQEQPDFDHTKVEPVKLRPFKPKYHLTMALSALEPDDLLQMDNTYADRIKYRISIMKKHPTIALNVHDEQRIAPAVREYYTFIMGTYLPLRFPSMFKLHEADYDTGKTFMLENRILGGLYPAFPIPESTQTRTLLETLGKTIDEDIFFLLPEDPSSSSDSDEKQPADPKYILQAYTCCCPSGFNTQHKLGQALTSIHAPVPGYKEILSTSMDRFFTKLEVGKYVKRMNWGISVDTELFAADPETMHAHAGDTVQELDTIDISKTFVRVERQTLHRLPTSKAIVFAFKTYLYPIEEIKGEGLGGELAEAIDGLKEGNVSGMFFYKRGPVWGEALKKYLRS